MMTFATLYQMANFIREHHIAFCDWGEDYVLDNCIKIKEYLNTEHAVVSVTVPAVMVYIENDRPHFLKTEITIEKFDRDYEQGGWTMVESVVDAREE
jgi:hypothetical protein